MNVIFTDYIKYRATLRGFNLNKIENILRYSQEKYFDVETRQQIKPGRVGNAFLPTKDKVSVIAFRMHDAMTDTLFGGKPKICLFNGFRYLGVPEELILIPASAQNNAENGSFIIMIRRDEMRELNEKEVESVSGGLDSQVGWATLFCPP